MVTATSDAPEERDGFRFRGGSRAIDLPATLQGRLKPSPREQLNTPNDLRRWLVAAGLARAAPHASGEDLAVALALREAIYALARSLHDGGDAGQARATLNALETLNRIASGAPAVPQLLDGGVVELQGGTDALIVTLAREAVYLFGSESAKHIRQCESPTCTLFFIDTSRRGDRRWCSMSACGNRAKLAEFRRRRAQRAP